MRASAACFSLLLLLHHLTSSALAAGGSPQRILILDSLGHRQDIVPALRVELGRLCPEPIDFFEQSLEASRLSLPEQQQAMIEFLTIYLETSPPGLVVAVGVPAMDFFAQVRGQRFKDIPFVVIGADRRRMSPELRTGLVTTVETQIDPAGFIGDMLRILPETRNIYFFIGACAHREVLEASDPSGAEAV